MKPLDLEKELEGATPERLAKSLLAPRKRQPVKVKGAPSSYPPTSGEEPMPNED